MRSTSEERRARKRKRSTRAPILLSDSSRAEGGTADPEKRPPEDRQVGFGELRAADNDPSEEMPPPREGFLAGGHVPGSRDVWTRSGSKHAWTNEDKEYMLQNTLVVVIGTGKKVCTLAERRLHEKGRLLVLLTDRAPARTYDDDGGIRWFPPNRKPPVGEQARQMVHKFNSYAA